MANNAATEQPKDCILATKDKDDVEVLGAAVDDDDVETGESTSSMDEDQDQKTNLAKKETMAVFRLRLLVFLVLFLAAVAVSVIVYTLTANAEKDEYQNQYEGAAKKVLESFMDIVDSKLGAVTSIAIANIAHGVDHVKSWPFVTLSSFQQRASTARKQSGAMYVHINPMVTDAQKTEWEAFVSKSSEDSYWM